MKFIFLISFFLFLISSVSCNLIHHRLVRHSQRFNVNERNVEFPVHGSFGPRQIYSTTLALGTPPREYELLIDTGDEISWLSSSRCGRDCTRFPRTTGFYDPGNSSSARAYAPFSIKYGNGDTSSGYMIADLLHMDIQQQDRSAYVNFSAPVEFGISTSQSGSLLWAHMPMDGILGLGPGNLSLVSQLARMNITPNIFSLCLTEDDGIGGGFLIFGKVEVPRIVYSPLVPSQSNYSLNLQGVAVGGTVLKIHRSAFFKPATIDSGAILAFFPTAIFKALVNAVTTTVSPHATPLNFKGFYCYTFSNSSIINIFPQVILSFEGNAPLILEPKHYLLRDMYNTSSRCLAFQESPTNSTVLGDVALKDRMVVFDPIQQKIGWVDYNCSKPYSSISSMGISRRNQDMMNKILRMCSTTLLAVYLSS